MFASTRKKKGMLYIPIEMYHWGYVNAGAIQEHDYLMLGAKKPGFYCTWNNLFYLTKSRKIFKLNPPLLTRVGVCSVTGVYIERGTFIPVKFSPVRLEELYADMFS